MFDISYFRQNPLPFYTLAHELYPGQYHPTITHCFARLLHDKGLLLKLFTQNIDCLERKAGLPDEKIVEAHGSFAKQRCIDCKTEHPDELMRQAVQEKQVPRCQKDVCGGLVKPDIVFFGEGLPEAFARNRSLPASADLAIIMGTSLTVQPFASLPSFVGEDVPRVLINFERAGGIGSRADDVLVLEDCDSGVRMLAEALGWLEELEELWQQTNPDAASAVEKDQRLPSKTMHDKVEEEVDNLTRDIDTTLRVSRDHSQWLTSDLQKDNGLSFSRPPKENNAAQTSESSKESLNQYGDGHGNGESKEHSEQHIAGRQDCTEENAVGMASQRSEAWDEKKLTEKEGSDNLPEEEAKDFPEKKS